MCGVTRPQIYEVWTFGEDGVTREVHPTSRIDVGAGFVGEFATDYLTPSWRRVPIFGVNSINGSVQWLGVPHFVRTDGTAWTDNILDPSTSWGNCGTNTNPNLGSQSGVTYGSVSVPCSGHICAMPAFVRRSPENTRSAVRRVRDNIL